MIEDFMIVDLCRDMIDQFHFLDCRLVAATRALSHSKFQEWLAADMHADLRYLAQTPGRRADLREVFSFAKSVFVVTEDYSHFQSPSSLSIARYARGEDYHHSFRKKLEGASDFLKSRFPDEKFEIATDTLPILERDFAVQAGHGWIGKNNCLISRTHGSFFFLGEIISSLSVGAADGPAVYQEAALSIDPDFCGTCTRCLTACPTGALEAPRKLNANKCVSYWNIESRDIPPEEIRPRMGSLFFGCDICQDVCPWNRKKLTQSEGRSRQPAEVELKFFLTASGKQIERHIRGTALRRAGPFGLRRNAIVVSTNLGLNELRPDIRALGIHDKLRPLVEWSEQAFDRSEI